MDSAIELVTLNTSEAAVNRSKLENDLTHRRHVMENTYASDVLVLANKLLPVCVSLFNLTSHIVAPAHPTRRRLRTHWFASTAQEYTPTIVHM